MKLQIKATRGGEVLEKRSEEHETASKSNKSKRVIREVKQGT